MLNVGVEFDDVLNVEIKYIPTFRFDEVFQILSSKIINDIPRRAESVLLKTDILHLFRCTLMLLSIKEHMKFYKEFRKYSL